MFLKLKLMIKKTILFLIISFQYNCLHSQNHDYKWNNENYEVYNYNSFQKLEFIHEKIQRDKIDYDLLNASIFFATNIQRVKYKRKPFEFSKALYHSAQEHSEDMVKYNFYSHTSKVKGKKTMSDRLNRVGISNAYMAENIYNFFLNSPTYWSLAEGLVEGWMNSKGHKANILNRDYRYLGCGSKYYFNKEWPDSFYVKSTQNFSSKEGQ